MPVTRRLTMSECEGFDPEVAECFAHIEPTEFLDADPKHVTIKPKPIARCLTMSECEGFDSEVAQWFEHREVKEFHDMVPRHVTIKPRPHRPQPPFQWDCSEEIKQEVKEVDLQLQLTDALTKVDIIRADLQDARLRFKCLKVENRHLERHVRQLLNEKMSLRKETDCLLKEVDMLRTERLCVHSGDGEGVGLAPRSGAAQTSCIDHIVSDKQDNKLTKHHELSQNNVFSGNHMPFNKISLIENCNQKQNVKKSRSFLRRLTKLFRRKKC
ncbi:uncharacterized protein [Haliotis asinina]|uniref:uncharacterized protein n=1 Tax=Haliotis asinina TaxID=109174 RepID=UPI003531B7D2